MKPSTLVLDEPVAGLDPAGREELLQLIQGIHQSGTTVVLVSHSMDDVARFCTRLIVMNKGRVAFDAPPREVFRHGSELREMGLDVPECARLCELLREKGMDLPEGIFRVQDCKRAILSALGEGSKC